MFAKSYGHAGCIALAVSLVLPPAFAQSEFQSNRYDLLAALDPVVVSAARIEQPLSEVLPSLTVITREEIERAQAPTLIELLQGEPGIEVGRNGGPGAVSSLFLRGQNSISTAVFIDGVRLQTDQLGTIRLNNIPTNLIERIEILRGNVSALYGESAIGGVVNIFTRRGAGPVAAQATLGVGSRGTNQVIFGVSGLADDVSFRVSVERYSTEGFSARNPAQVTGGTNPDNDGFDRESIFLSAEKQLRQALAVGFSASQILSHVEFDDGFGSTRVTEGREGNSRNTDGTLYLKITSLGSLQSRLAVSWSEEDYKEFVNQFQLSEVSGGYIFGKQRTVRLDNTYGLDAGSIVFGAENSGSDFRSRGNTHERKTQGIYFGYLGRAGQWNYQLNVRNDEVTSESGAESIKSSKATWLAGLGYSINEVLRLTAAISTGFRAPATGELYGYGGSTGLRPETHKSYEFGIESDTSIGISRIVLFDSRAKSAIVFNSSIDSGKGYCELDCYQNIARTENQGIEFYHRGAIGQISGKASFVFQKPRNKSEVSFSGQQNDRLARRADRYGSIEVSTKQHGVEFGARISYSGDRVDGSQNLSAYTLFDMTASYEIQKNWFARLKLENVFDKNYQLAYGFNTPGRGVFASLEYRP
jgi:vitamin B12 transporter